MHNARGGECVDRERARLVSLTICRRLVCALCIGQCAVLVSCARTSLPTTAIDPAPRPVAALSVSSLSQLRADLVALTQSPGVQRGTWGIVVQSLDRSERLFELNPRTLLVPASVAKLASVATAADAVGWEYRFETTLRTNGTVDNGTLHGDLFIVGSGDPAIGARGGDDVDGWIDALKESGVRRIDGRIIGDDNGIEEPRPALAWAWDDLGYPTGALFGALNYGENKTLVTITPGTAPGEPTTIALDAVSQGRPLINRSVTGALGSRQMVWPEQRPGETALTIAGSVPVGGAPARLMISAGNPTLWFATVLRNRLRLAGVEVTGDAFDIDDVEARPATTTLFVYRSHPLSQLAGPLLKESINLYGEAVMRLNAAPGTLPTNDAALAGFRARLAAWGVPTDGQQLIDGSGLSRRDVVAADTLLAILVRMYDRSEASPWMRALPIAGVDGSLENRMKGTLAERNVRAKTGTMSNIRSLAGYVTTADGEQLAFVIMLNDFEGSAASALQAIDAMAVRLASFRR
jgi:D-alanyl-D-alanine carboxypeptidase/D-alanyl-D-alanine-endopeptidase (penicillin-binding protein 4)